MCRSVILFYNAFTTWDSSLSCSSRVGPIFLFLYLFESYPILFLFGWLQSPWRVGGAHLSLLHFTPHNRAWQLSRFSWILVRQHLSEFLLLRPYLATHSEGILLCCCYSFLYFFPYSFYHFLKLFVLLTVCFLSTMFDSLKQYFILFTTISTMPRMSSGPWYESVKFVRCKYHFSPLHSKSLWF